MGQEPTRAGATPEPVEPIAAEGAARLTVVVPTLNEAAGIQAFLTALLAATAGLDQPAGSVEVLVVDDRSSDGTAELARAALGSRGRVIEHQGERSLARSVIEGWRVARGHVLGVMDADSSHPPDLLPRLLAEIEERGTDVAVATRYMPGGGTAGWPLQRKLASRVASTLAFSVVRARDPMSGYLLLRREVIEGVPLDPRGWKIGLEVLARGRYERLAEVPYVFRERHVGRSKFGRRAVIDYLAHLGRLWRDKLRWT